MDKFENEISTEENIDTWDLINDDFLDDTQEFEIIKDLFNSVEEKENVVTKYSDKNINNNASQIKHTHVTDESGETTEEDIEDNKKFDQDIKKPKNKSNFVEKRSSKLSTKKDTKFKKKSLTEKCFIRKREENKKKNKKGNNKKSCPFFNSTNLGALLTAFGLSLIFLNSSEKTEPCSTNREAKDITETLINSIKESRCCREDITRWLEDDNLLAKIPPNFSLDCFDKKNLKSKICKRIDRRIKQQARGFDLKSLRTKRKKLEAKPQDFIGPLNKDEIYLPYNLNKPENNSKIKTYREALLTEDICPVKDVSSEEFEPKKPEIQNYCCLTTNPGSISESSDLDQNETNANNENLENCDDQSLKKRYNCISFYRDLIKAEMSFKKLMNNTYDIPKPKTPTDLAYNIENKINNLTEDNILLSNIIEEQENLIKKIEEKIEFKKQVLNKRSQQKHTLQKRLKFANWMKQQRIDDTKDQKPASQTNNISEKIINEMLSSSVHSSRPFHNTLWIPSGKSSRKSEKPKKQAAQFHKSTTEIATRVETKGKNLENNENCNEVATSNAFIMKRKQDSGKKDEVQKFNECKTKKMKDEEHCRLNKLPEKGDPKRTWIKKKNEFY